MSIFSFLVIKQAKYHYSNNPSRDQGVLARKVGSPGDIRLEPRVRDSPILAFRGRSYEFSKEKLTVFRGPKIMGLGKMVTSALNIWSFLVSIYMLNFWGVVKLESLSEPPRCKMVRNMFLRLYEGYHEPRNEIPTTPSIAL